MGTVGRVGAHLEIKIADPATLDTVPRGAAGEPCTRGYGVMTGCWNDPDKTAEAIDTADWMRTCDVAVREIVGVPDEKYGEELMAWLRLKDVAPQPNSNNIREFCTGRIAHYKIPRYVRVINEFPMTVTGSIRKVELHELGIKQLTTS